MPSDAPLPSSNVNHIFVRALTVEAHIGYYAHEKGRTQPLVIDVEIEVPATRFGGDDIHQTIDYTEIVRHARSIAETHVDLVETYAERLATLCLAHPRAVSVRVRVEKPEAVPGAMAGIEIVRLRAGPEDPQ